jgi:hypothetical protein
MIDQKWYRQQFRRRTYAVESFRPWAISPHSVPMTASAKNAIGRKQAGCLRKRINDRGSMVEVNAMNHTIIKITTAVVDHGREAATRRGSKSTQKSQNRDRVADKKSQDTSALFRVDLSAASNMFIKQLRVMCHDRSGRLCQPESTAKAAPKGPRRD